MSSVTVSNTETQNMSRIFLTPTKRKRVTTETSLENHMHTIPVNENMNKESPSIEEIWRWTMTPCAIATCFVKDVFDMKENLFGGADFYWLGRVPCRSVRLVGLVVGVQVYETRMLYSIDDGTAVVDCVHRVQRTAKSPTKKPKSTSNPFREMPVPIARIGRAIRVVGKVHRIYDTRQVQIDEIEVCKSANEEPIHWMKVRELHRTNYDIKEPFIILPPSVTAIPDTSKVNEPATPSTVMSTPSSSVANSPAKFDPAKLPKLRHPSRLRSRDLTDNTFQIYVKHYMIYAPDDNDDTFYDEPKTPTKCRRTSSDALLTPRPAKITNTPRPDVEPRESGTHRGFTLSYLRRVPELADLARRVVLAEAKRRSRDQRKKETEARSGSTSTSRTSIAVTYDIPKEKLRPKMKRLFNWAIVQMLQEGCIVLWDGPMRPCEAGPHVETSQLWKTSMSTSISSSVGVDSIIFSRSCGDVPSIEEISEPEAEEEGYMPITPLFLGDHVETAIRQLAEARTKPVSKLGVTRVSAGTTKEEILRKLHRDDRWRYIGEWQIREALEYLQGEKRAWCVGQDKWELTL